MAEEKEEEETEEKIREENEDKERLKAYAFYNGGGQTTASSGSSEPSGTPASQADNKIGEFPFIIAILFLIGIFIYYCFFK